MNRREIAVQCCAVKWSERREDVPNKYLIKISFLKCLLRRFYWKTICLHRRNPHVFSFCALFLCWLVFWEQSNHIHCVWESWIQGLHFKLEKFFFLCYLLFACLWIGKLRDFLSANSDFHSTFMAFKLDLLGFPFFI